MRLIFVRIFPSHHCSQKGISQESCIAAVTIVVSHHDGFPHKRRLSPYTVKDQQKRKPERMGACCSVEDTPEEKAQKSAAVKKQVQDQLRSKSLRNNVLQQSGDENPLDKYQVVRQLGVGSMGSVDLVRRRRRLNHPDEPTATITTSSATSKDSQNSSDGGGEERLYALKTLRVGRVTKAYLRELQNEIRIVSDLDHPGIVKFYQVYYTSDKHIYIVMELCSGGDLYKREPYTEKQACNVVQQILSAVAYMHSRGYVHRDIKV